MRGQCARRPSVSSAGDMIDDSRRPCRRIASGNANGDFSTMTAAASGSANFANNRVDDDDAFVVPN